MRRNRSAALWLGFVRKARVGVAAAGVRPSHPVGVNGDTDVPSSRRTSTRRTVATLAAAMMATPLVAAVPAHGKVVESGSETVVFVGVADDFCDVEGLSVQFDVAGVVDYRIDVRGSKGYAFYSERVTFDTTFTNLANGTSIRNHERSLFKDVTVKDNGDGTHTIIYFGTGNAALYDASGKAIARNPGQVRFEVVLDLNGTPGDIDDDIFISETLILGSTGRNDDFCAAAVPALTG